jgi:hypothetical protein
MKEREFEIEGGEVKHEKRCNCRKRIAFPKKSS